jgi:hypothetical protein
MFPLIGVGLLEQAPQASLVSYVATKLPNVPSARRQAVADAATDAASGQSYTPESVIDAIVLAILWLSPDPLSCFQDSDATTPAASGQPVGAMQPWVGSVVVTQSNPSSKGILSSYGINFDGSDDVLTGSLPQSTTQFSLIAVLKSDSVSGIRIPVYLGNASINGYGFDWEGSEGALFGGVVFLGNGPRTTSTGIYGLTRGSISKFFLNGNEKTLSNNTPSATPADGTFYFGGYPGAYFDGIVGDLFVYDSEFADRAKIERFLNAYRGLGLL